MVKSKKNALFHIFFDISSSNLCILLNSLKASIDESSKKIKEILKGAFFVLHAISSRREDYTGVSEPKKFSL